MTKASRKNEILELINLNNEITLNALATTLDVSEMTVRRYLKELEKDEVVIRTTNGFLLLDSLSSELPFLKKQMVNIESKREIAEKAVKFIKPGETILLDAGTTTLELCKLLKNQTYKVTVITNDIKAANELVDSEHKVIITGGVLQNDVGSIYGIPTMHFLRDIRVEKAFIATQAASVEKGIFAPTLEKCEIKELMLEAGNETFLLVDESKFNQTSFAKIANLSAFDYIILNDDADLALKEKLSQITTVL